MSPSKFSLTSFLIIISLLCTVWSEILAARCVTGAQIGSGSDSSDSDSGGTTMSSEQLTKVDNFVEAILSCRNIPGLSLSIVRKDKVVLAKGYGYRELQFLSKVRNDTIFCIGSLTKGFTATLLAILLGRNRSLSWDTPLKEILGDTFQMCDEHRTQYMNLRDILAHKTGIPGYFGAFMTGFEIEAEELVRRMRFFKATDDFHSRYMYNNYMYMLAGYVAEKMSNRSFEHLIVQEIFQPLGMTSSILMADVNLKQHNIALPHMAFRRQLQPLDPVLFKMVYPATAAGGICTTALDMAKWMTFQLARGRDSSGRELAPSVIFKELHTPQIPTPTPLGKKVLRSPIFPVSAGRFAYNMGWGSGTYRGYNTLLHGGRLAGYDSLIYLYPTEQLGILVAVNGPMNSDAVDGLRVIQYFVADLLLGIDTWLNTTTGCTFPGPWIQNKNKPDLDVDCDVTISTTSADVQQTNHKSVPVKRNVNIPHDLSNPNRTIYNIRHQRTKGIRTHNHRVKKSSLERKRRLTFGRRYHGGRPLTDYAGVYGHHAFGNITVYFNSSDGLLHLRHGKYGHALLYPGALQRHFNMRFVGPLRYVSEADGWGLTIPIAFESDYRGIIDTIHAIFIEPLAPPEFKRDLKWLHSSQLPGSFTKDGLCSCSTGLINNLTYVFAWLLFIIATF